MVGNCKNIIPSNNVNSTRVTTAAGEGDIELTCVSLTSHSSGVEYRISVTLVESALFDGNIKCAFCARCTFKTKPTKI